jgi:hypothetical protein
MLLPRLRLLLPNETDAIQTLSRVPVEDFAGGAASGHNGKGFWTRRARLLLSAVIILNAALSSAALAGGNRAQAPTSPKASSVNAEAQRKILIRSPLLRQDLFDRANPTNVRTNWPAPPAQPGQF